MILLSIYSTVIFTFHHKWIVLIHGGKLKIVGSFWVKNGYFLHEFSNLSILQRENWNLPTSTCAIANSLSVVFRQVLCCRNKNGSNIKRPPSWTTHLKISYLKDKLRELTKHQYFLWLSCLSEGNRVRFSAPELRIWNSYVNWAKIGK